MLKCILFFSLFVTFKVAMSMKNKETLIISETIFRAALITFSIFAIDSLFGFESYRKFDDYKPNCRVFQVISQADKERLYLKEREMYFKAAEAATRAMHKEIELADKKASKIRDIKARRVMREAIKAAIASLGGASSKEKALIAALYMLSEFAGEAFDHYVEAQEHLKNARKCAADADFFQEKLWTLDPP